MSKITREEISNLTREELIELVLGKELDPVRSIPKVVKDLQNLDPETNKILKEQGKLLLACLKTLHITVPIKLKAFFHNMNTYYIDGSIDGKVTVQFDILDNYHPIGMEHPEVKARVEEINRIVKETRRLVTEVSKQTGIPPNALWNHLQG